MHNIEKCNVSFVEAQNNNEESDKTLQYVSALTDTLTNCSNNNTLWQDLQTLIVEHCISYNIANELLKILRKHGHIELPSDVRNLVKTPRNAYVKIKKLGNGHYVHFGIFSALERFMKVYTNFIRGDKIKLNINIDGLPICKSSDSQFWPIMASIEGIDVYTSPFIVGVYHGMCKPNNANDFLTDFVNDFLLLSQNSIIICNKKYSVSFNAILCDAPVRSFITQTKGHTRYFACLKCVQEGDFAHYRVIFPETHNNLRTNDTFKNRAHIEHHTGDSILEKTFHWYGVSNLTGLYVSILPRCYEKFITVIGKR